MKDITSKSGDQNKFAMSQNISWRINSVVENFCLFERKADEILRNSFQSIFKLVP